MYFGSLYNPIDRLESLHTGSTKQD